MSAAPRWRLQRSLESFRIGAGQGSRSGGAPSALVAEPELSEADAPTLCEPWPAAHGDAPRKEHPVQAPHSSALLRQVARFSAKARQTAASLALTKAARLDQEPRLVLSAHSVAALPLRREGPTSVPPLAEAQTGRATAGADARHSLIAETLSEATTLLAFLLFLGGALLI